MGTIKKKGKGRGPDKKRRKSRAHKSTDVSPTATKKNILRDIIDAVSSKVTREKEEPWSLDIGPPVRVSPLGRHIFKREKTVEIDIKKL